MASLFDGDRSDPSSDLSPEVALGQGLAALKQKSYAKAVPLLEAASQSAPQRADQLKAQMGLVKAYERLGQVETAIAHCQRLCHDANPQVQAWAQQALKDLKGRQTQPASPSATQTTPAPAPQGAPNPTGFVPLDDPSAVPPPPTQSTPPGNATGFVAFESPAATPLRPRATPQASPRPAKPTQTTAQPHAKHPPTEATPPTVTPAPDAHSPVDPTPPADQSGPETVTPPDAQPHRPEGIPADEVSEQPASAEAEQPEAEPYVPTWRQAGRANTWRPISQTPLASLWLTQAVTAIAIIWTIRTGLRWLLESINETLISITWPISPSPIRLFYQDPLWLIVGVFLVLLAVSPWLWDWLLRQYYGQQDLEWNTLNTHSPEAVRLIRRVSNQQGRALPQLRLLPTAAPMILTYGNLPRFARISVSQGLLNQLTDDEIATLYGRELSHINRWDSMVMSWVALIAQLPYVIYWQVAQWGDRQRNHVIRGVAAFIVAAAYGGYWLIRWLGLWLSRMRTYYGDRAGAELTGNPNGLTRALLKIAIGTANDVQRQGYTSYTLEGLDLLTPLEPRQCLTLGSSYAHCPIEPLLVWDYTNPYRFWLALNRTHPPTGERLYILKRYAQHWKLEPELDLPSDANVAHRPRTFIEFVRHWQPFLKQASPWFGLLIGLCVAILFWVLGTIAYEIYWTRFSWLAERSTFISCLMIGFGLGLWLRVNSVFPDLKPAHIQAQPDWSSFLNDPYRLPIEPTPVRYQGKLLGRPGIANWLRQDLLLQTQQGLLKLQHCSALGVPGNLILQSARTRPDSMVGRQIQTIGWFRRGITAWVDVETLKTQDGRVSPANPPMASTLLGGFAILWGLYILYRGGA